MTFQEIYELIVRVLTFPVTVSAGGGVRFSIFSLLAGIFVFLVAWRASRIAQDLVQRTVLARVPIDPGIAYTLRRLVHFGLLTIGGLLGLKVGVGLDLTSLAVIFTALSVGIGLGLKEISSDVAAGFVLLFERPVRVGDRVRLGAGSELEGDVIEIGLRTTKVRTPDNTIVIVPNSKLTNDTYVNWSLGDPSVRVRIRVGVAYESDVEKVREGLLAAAGQVEGVSADPAPDVQFMDFGDSSLDFDLLAWIPDPAGHPRVRSDLRFAIAREFAAAGIQIPFPQRDLNIRMVAGRVKIPATSDLLNTSSGGGDQRPPPGA